MRDQSTPHLDPRTENLLDRTFNRWTVIAFAGYRHGNAYWTCQCECGNVKDRAGYNLQKGHSQSCGCRRNELTSQQKTTHGQTYTPEFKAWQQMFVRCYNPKSRSYKDYGERGITVCESWHNSFETFYADMGARPTPSHTLERMRNNEGYSPENCRWATMKEQGNNRRTNKLITHNGSTHTLMEWAESAGLSLQAFRQRLVAGWSMDDALSTPARPLTATNVPTMLTLHGTTQSLAEWAKEYHLSYTTLFRRLVRGWTLEDALLKPSAPQKRPKNSY